jgi:hypothetical protein
LIIFSIGLPGRFAEWCDSVVACIASRLGGPVVAKAWPVLGDMLGYEGVSSALDEATLALIATGASHLVIGARQPDERLRLALAETNATFIVALDDPRIAVADILTQTRADLHAVTRAVANSCPLVTRYGLLPGAFRIDRQTAATDAAAAVAAMACHLGMPVSRTDAAGIVDELAARGSGCPENDPGNEWATHLPADAKSMVDGALAGYAGSFSGGGIGQIIWTRDLFIVAGDPSKRPIDVLDVSRVSGDDRFLIYGPYIHLPAGTWTARVVLGLSQEVAGHTLLIDAFAGRPLAQTSLQPITSGIYAPEITFTLGDASGPGLEIRVRVGSANATGQLAFGNVVLSRLAMREPESVRGLQTDFRAVLGL